MGSSNALIKTVPYRQEGEPEKHAAILRVDFDLDGLSPEEIQVLGHLVEASDALNPIYRDQIEPPPPLAAPRAPPTPLQSRSAAPAPLRRPPAHPPPAGRQTKKVRGSI